MKWKLLFAFFCIAGIAIGACGFGVWRFQQLEARMQAVNDRLVPTLKTLSQMESSLVLLESDLDKSFQEGILRPKDTAMGVMDARMDFLAKLEEGAGKDPLAMSLVELQKAYKELAKALDAAYGDWQGRAKYEERVSSTRAQLRHALKTAMRDADREIRLGSISVQNEMSRSGIIVTLLLGICFIMAMLFAYWVNRSLHPLSVLAASMRRISSEGLSEGELRGLSHMPSGKDEISVLTGEFTRMAFSLHEKNRELEQKKKNLESAHLEMAKQNVMLRKTQAKLLHSEKLGLAGRLASQMAHEIRNPLNALGLHFDILDMKMRPEHGAEAVLTPIRREIDKLMEITRSYLDLSKPPRLETNLLNLNDLVEELQDFYAPLYRSRGIQFVCDLGKLPSLPLDKAKLSQVLVNLLKNAEEAFPEGFQGLKKIRLSTSFDEASGSVFVSVEDNGLGIDKQARESIFSPFFTTKAEGTGLGLAHSRQVIEAHGGEIDFYSEKNAGAKFILRLPMVQSQHDASI